MVVPPPSGGVETGSRGGAGAIEPKWLPKDRMGRMPLVAQTVFCRTISLFAGIRRTGVMHATSNEARRVHTN